MEGYDVVDRNDHKVGHVVETHDGFLIVESGMLRKTKHAVPLDVARTDAEENVVRLTLAKEMVEEGPTIDEDTDWQQVRDFYGLSAELEGQTAGVESADEQRARMRESHTPDTEVGPAKGAVGIHQDRWEVKE
jgi:hypothetical protein